MKQSTSDQIEGNVHALKGQAKQKVGEVIGNPDLEAEGQKERLAGEIQKKAGQIEKVFEK